MQSPVSVWRGWTEPTTSGEISRRREAVLLNVLAGMIVLSLFTQMIQIVSFNGDAIIYAWWGVNVLVLLGCYSLLRLARSGRHRVAAAALVLVFEALAVTLVLVDGPQSPIWPAVVAVGVLLASILLGARESLFTLVGSTAILIPLMFLTRRGQPLHLSSIEHPYPPNAATVLAVVGLFGLMATACWLYTRDVLTTIDELLTAGSSESPLKQLRTGAFTMREVEVVRLVAEGLSNDDIAKALFISPRTAQTHVANAMRKSESSNRTELGVLAIREGLVPLAAGHNP